MAYDGRRLGVAVVAATLMVVLAAAVPAFAQDSGDAQYGGDNNTAICQNVIEELNIGGQSGEARANAVAQYFSDATAIAAVAQELNISISQVNECLNTFVVKGDTPVGGTPPGGTDDVGGATTGGVPEKGVIASTIPEKGLLPVTGGMPLLSSGVLLGLAIIGTGLAILRAEIRRGSDRSDER